MTLMMDAAFLGLLYSPPAYADADVNAYISAVELADGGGAGSTPVQLEQGIRDAINIFITGCKTDGIWGALTQCSLLMGARTLAGALIRVKGSVDPTSVGFVAGDYNRRRVLGDGISKHLVFPTISAVPGNLSTTYTHYAFQLESLPGGSSLSGIYGADISTENVGITYYYALKLDASNILLRHFTFDVGPTLVRPSVTPGFYGMSRPNDTTVAAIDPTNGPVTGIPGVIGIRDWVNTMVLTPRLFSITNTVGASDLHTAAGISFLASGQNIDLAALGSRTAALRSAIYGIVP